VRVRPRYHGLLRRSPRPILATHDEVWPFRRALVAFDGGSRSEQALFVGAYLAAKLATELVVVTVQELARPAATALTEARAYLERFGVAAQYVERAGPVAEALVEAAEAHESDLMLIGAYRYSRWLESLLGGVVVRTLLAAKRPVLVL
jgi:nucleotide-binding universal stress UspA family protein